MAVTANEYTLDQQNKGYRDFNEDTTPGLYYLHARYYDPQTRQFLTKDPAGMKNLYAYCKKDPINDEDPTGQLPYKKIGLAVLGIFELAGFVIGIIKTIKSSSEQKTNQLWIWGAEMIACTIVGAGTAAHWPKEDNIKIHLSQNDDYTSIEFNEIFRDEYLKQTMEEEENASYQGSQHIDMNDNSKDSKFQFSHLNKEEDMSELDFEYYINNLKNREIIDRYQRYTRKYNESYDIYEQHKQLTPNYFSSNNNDKIWTDIQNDFYNEQISFSRQFNNNKSKLSIIKKLAKVKGIN